MLTQITISNFAIIDELEINLNSGLIVLTGETGAGKSIILDALDFLLGSRSNSDFIKAGKAKAKVEGCFNLESSISCLVTNWLKENDFYEEDSNQIIISRELTPQGSKARINGTICNISHLTFLRNYFLDLHEQSEHIELLKESKQLDVIDNYGSKEISNHLSKYKEKYIQLQEIKSHLNKKTEDIKDISSKLEILNHQISEIEEASIIDITEDVKLEEKRELIVNKRELIESASNIYELINGECEASTLSTITKAKKLINSCSDYDESFCKHSEKIESIIEELKEISSFTNDYAESLADSNDNLDEIEDRLNLLYKLKKKYGNSLEEIVSSYESAKKELSNLENSNLSKEELESKYLKLEEESKSLAKSLSALRIKYSNHLSNKVSKELSALGFNKVSFKVDITSKELSDSGADTVQFLFSSNPDEPLKPISKVVSGGELSRIMLAVKSICGKDYGTLIFDEIDSGISGEVASSVARKLYTISRNNQVICITHQPIIAAMADEHFVVKKKVDSGSTVVEINQIDAGNKEDALATLLSPEKVDKEVKNNAKQYAKSLIDNAEKIKVSL